MSKSIPKARLIEVLNHSHADLKKDLGDSFGDTVSMRGLRNTSFSLADRARRDIGTSLSLISGDSVTEVDLSKLCNEVRTIIDAAVSQIILEKPIGSRRNGGVSHTMKQSDLRKFDSTANLFRRTLKKAQERLGEESSQETFDSESTPSLLPSSSVRD